MTTEQLEAELKRKDEVLKDLQVALNMGLPLRDSEAYRWLCDKFAEGLKPPTRKVRLAAATTASFELPNGFLTSCLPCYIHAGELNIDIRWDITEREYPL